MKQRLIVVGWDGADWEIARPLMEQGKMPQLQEMVARGASGSLRSSPPYLSPMLWTTMATGKSPAEHGIAGFREFNPSSQSHQPVSSSSRKTKAIWNILSQEGWKTHVVGWFATYPAEPINGVVVSDLFGQAVNGNGPKEVLKGLVSPEEISEDLASGRVSPEEIDPGLIEFFIPRLRDVDLERDKRPLALRKRLAELYTYHNAAVVLLQEEVPDFLTVYYHFIDWVCHDFMEFAPPHRAGVSGRDFELYKGVVDAAYVLQDLLLRDLLRHAGGAVNCLVVSDHGFLSADERPKTTANVDGGIAAWHRLNGIFVGVGSVFKRGETGLRATLFDLAPTILHALDLPVGADMPGHVIEGFLVKETRAETIPSWDSYGEPYQRVAPQSLGSDASEELLRQFADLGYISAEDERKEVAESKTRRENGWNLGIALMGERRFEEALSYLEEAYFYHPEASHKALPLVRCQVELGLIEESLRTQESLLDYGPSHGPLCYHLAILSRSRGDFDEALSLLEQADEWGGDRHDTALERGLILLCLGRYEEAAVVFRQETRTHTTASAQLGLCRALAMLGQFDEAEARLLIILQDRPDFSVGWFTLGIIYEKNSDPEKAKAAYAKAIQWRADFNQAQARKFMLEREGANELTPFIMMDLDFRELPAAKEARKKVEKVAAIREASNARHRLWQSEQDYKRSQENPISILEGVSPALEGRKTIVIVSGLPRSGTSLMMQMLASGGTKLQVDDQREPDVHNPRGFFEWEPILRLEQNGHILSEAVGKAVKVVSAQLRFLPKLYAYKIIWMHRPLSEVIHSQAKMLASEVMDSDGKPKNEEMLRAHRDHVLQSLRRYDGDKQSAVSLLELDYADCLYQPDSVQKVLADFLLDLLPHPEQMSQVVDPALYRNREVKEDDV
jgi:predicted AlkP superfamily phosphohydrolase/phosphomutase/tetratricopeptide (TPR) repeat protein